MKQCPKCRNKGWKPTADFKAPLRNFGKQKHGSFAIRYMMCLNCGYRFKTIEEYFGDVSREPGLFDEEDEHGA